MAVQGPFVWFDYALKKVVDGTINLESQAVKAALLSSSQSITRSFTGSSGNAQYSDLTGELVTANGYTAGGTALGNRAFNRPFSNYAIFKSDPLVWTLTATITFKYILLYVDGATNKDLLMFADMDTGGGSVTAAVGVLNFSPDPTYGWGYWSQS